MPTAILNGAKIFYEVHGRGFPLVLTHGLGGDHLIWMEQARFFKDRYQVVLWDCRGHGRSEVTEEGYSLAQFVEDLHALLSHLGLERAHIGGLSMGGWISWSFALAHPEAAASLVLSDSAGLQEGLSEEERAAKRKMFEASAAVAAKKGRGPLVEVTLSLMFAPGFLEGRPDLAALVRKQIEDDPGLGYARTIQGMFIEFWETPVEEAKAKLSRLRTPTLVIAGELDQLTPPATQKALAEAIPGARLELIPGAGHVPNLEQPELWNRLALEFLSGLDR